MAVLSIKRVLALPEDLDSNTMYIVQGQDGLAELVFTGSSAQVVKKIIDKETVLELIDGVFKNHQHSVNDLDAEDIVKDVLNSKNVGEIREKLNIPGIMSTNSIIYDANGVIEQVKEFIGTAVAGSDGAWTIDYSHVGFTKIIGAVATAVSTGPDSADRKIVTFNVNNPTLTSCQGRVMSATSAGLLAAMTLLNSSGRVYLRVYGN